MTSSPERPTDGQSPAQFAPRWVRDPKQPRGGMPAPATTGGPWRNENETAHEGYAQDSYPPMPEMPARRPARRPFAIIGQVALIALVSAAAAILVIVFFPRKPSSDAIDTASEAISAASRTFGLAAPETVRPKSAQPQYVAPRQQPAQLPAEDAAPAPATAPVPPPTTVAVARPVGPPVRGVTDTEIRFGIAAPFSGAARELGRQMKLGVETAFNVANSAGGVHGRSLRLIAADDGYEPARTAEAMKALYDKEQVFGMVGNVGTPTAMVALPYALERRMLFYGAFTGAGLLRRDPPDRYVFNYRASYAEETDATVRYLVKVRRLRPEQIAVFAQQDGFGDSGFAGVAKAMRTLRGGDGGAILRLNYKRNTTDVEEAVAQLRAHRIPIKAVVMVPTYRAAAKFIEKTKDTYPGLIYTNVSFVGSTELANELMLLGPRFAEGVIVTQVVPALDGYSTAILDYKSALAKYFPGEAPDYVSLEGYIAGSVLIEALKRNGPQLDTERLVETMENMRNLDLGLGTVLDFGRTEHQASHKIWGTMLDPNGKYQALELQ